MNNLIFVCGWGCDHKSYNKLTRSLPNKWTILYIERDKINTEEELLEIINNKKFKKIYLVGHSLGGELCIKFSIRYPERIYKLFLINSVGCKFKKNLTKFILTGIHSERHFFLAKSVKNLRLIKKLLTQPKHFHHIKYAHRLDLEDSVAKIKIPTHILWGEKDTLISIDQGKRLHQLIPNSQFTLLPKMDHNWPIHAPYLFWNNIIEASTKESTNQCRGVAVIIQNNQILLIHRIKNGKEYFVFPGGSVEDEETPEKTIVRELQEEFTIDITIKRELFQINDTFNNRTRIEYYFLVNQFTGTPIIGGEEKDRMTENNQYHPNWINLSEIKNIPLFPQEAKEKIIKLFVNN